LAHTAGEPTHARLAQLVERFAPGDDRADVRAASDALTPAPRAAPGPGAGPDLDP
jgi:hypothetical protein